MYYLILILMYYLIFKFVCINSYLSVILLYLSANMLLNIKLLMHFLISVLLYLLIFMI